MLSFCLKTQNKVFHKKKNSMEMEKFYKMPVCAWHSVTEVLKETRVKTRTVFFNVVKVYLLLL